MSGSALTPSHENGSPWLATLPRTERMNAKAAKVAKGAAVAAGDGRPAQPADRHRRFGSGNEWPYDSGHSFPGPSPPVGVASRRRRRPLPRLNGSRLSRLHVVDSLATLAAFAFIVVGAIAA